MVSDTLQNDVNGKAFKLESDGIGGVFEEELTPEEEIVASIERSLPHMNIDNIWRKLGTTGKYQLTQLCVILLCVFSISWHLLSTIFIGYEPEHLCNTPENESDAMDMKWSGYKNVTTQYSSCEIITFGNDTVVQKTGCIYGLNYSGSSHQSYVSEWDLVCGRGYLPALAQSLLILGQGAGGVFTSIADKIGRRRAFVYFHAIYLCVVFGTAFVREFWIFLLMRFVTGVLQQLVSLTSWICMLETFPDHYRPVMSLAGGVCWSIALALLAPIAYSLRFESWRTLQMVLSTSALQFVLALCFTDESLRWLIVKGRIKEATKLLRKACRMNNVSLESILQINNSYAAKELTNTGSRIDEKDNKSVTISSGTQMITNPINEVTDSDKLVEPSSITHSTTTIQKETLLTLFRHGRTRNQSLIMFFAWYPNNLTFAMTWFKQGDIRSSLEENMMYLLSSPYVRFVNVLVFFGLYLTPSFNFSNRYLVFFLNAVVEIPAFALARYLLSRIGRRKSAIILHGIAGVSLLLFTVLSSVPEFPQTVPAVMTILLLIGKLGISGSFNTLFVYTPELFPTNFRNSGLGIASFCGRFAGIIAPYSDKMAQIQSWLPGSIFAFLCLITAVLVSKLPETMGKELPQTIASMQSEGTHTEHKRVSSLTTDTT